MKRGHRPRAAVTCGTQAGYRRHQLDGTPYCAKCQRAHRAYTRARYRRLLAEPITTESEHGTVRGYQGGCRLTCCRRAMAKARFEQRHPGLPWQYKFEDRRDV